MKIIGKTESGNYIVEITPEEMRVATEKNERGNAWKWSDGFRRGVYMTHVGVHGANRLVEAAMRFERKYLGIPLRPFEYKDEDPFIFISPETSLPMSFDEFANLVLAGQFDLTRLRNVGPLIASNIKNALAEYVARRVIEDEADNG